MEPLIRPLQFYNVYVVRGTDLVLSTLLVTECEPLTRVSEMARWKISLARGIPCCPNFFFNFFCPTNVSMLWRIYVYIHISDCVQTVYELPLLPNNTAVKHFYTNLERCEVFTGYLSLWRRSGGDWANAWHWTERFTVCFTNRKQ